MFVGAHIATGLVVGNLTGNYPVALATSLLIDIDHLIPYVRHGIIWKPEILWKTITSSDDPYGDQRNILHSLLVWFGLSIVSFFLFPQYFIVFSVSYFVHILLDILDGSDMHPFYPLKYNVKGPIGYFSFSEMIFTAVVFAIFLVLYFI